MLRLLLESAVGVEGLFPRGADGDVTELMGYTAIEWCDKTLNPIIAFNVKTEKRGWFCEKVGTECAGCYAEFLNIGRFGNGVRFAVDKSGLVRIEFKREILDRPLRWRKPQRIFLCDMTDLFLRHHPFDWINEVFLMIYRAKQHFFQILTKRVDRALAWWNSPERMKFWEKHHLPPLNEFENFIFMASAGTQEAYDERMPLLIEMPVKYRGLSMEPMLERIDLTPPAFKIGDVVIGGRGTNVNCDDWIQQLDWLIPGGESGSKARAMNVNWPREVIARCEKRKDMGRPWPLPVFMKQVGSVPVMDDKEWRAAKKIRILSAKNRLKAPEGTVPLLVHHRKGGDPAEWPEGLNVRQFPKLEYQYAQMFPSEANAQPV